MYIIFDSQNLPIYTTSDEVEAEIMAYYEDGYYTSSEKNQNKFKKLLDRWF